MKEKLVEKLFHNICTEQELKRLIQLINQDPAPPERLVMTSLWQAVKDYPRLEKEVHDRIYSQVLAKISPSEFTSNTPILNEAVKMPFEQPYRENFKWVVVAASFLILIMSASWLLQKKVGPDVVQTAFGEQQSLELSDGSKVQLNANSQVTFESSWTEESNREIWLEGEAFFKVEKRSHTKQKFQVLTDDLTVEVLGTTFNVNSHGGKTSVYLEEGQIRLYLHDLDSTIQMEAGDLVIYSKHDQEIIQRKEEQAALHTSWTDGVLTFEEAPLQEVLQKIEQTYGVKFNVINTADLERKVNFPLPINELEFAMSMLNKTMDSLEIRKDGDVYLVE